MKQQQGLLPPLVETVVLKSELLGKKVYYSVIEPERSRDVNAKRSVLFLLHGLFGSHENWTANTRILEYLRDKNFIVVCPDAGDSWYTDNPSIPGHAYESYLLDELIPDAERRFNAGGERERRGIAGISMGGYGAFKFAFRRPEMFAFAASMSGAFHAASVRDGEQRQEVVPSIMNVFGHDDNVRANNDLFRFTADLSTEQISELPQLFFDCGCDDEFFQVNKEYSDLLHNAGIPHTFEQRPGGHSWSYWNINLKNLLDLADKKFNPTNG